MAILIPAAFVAGVIVAVSPCVLPVLPIVLAGGGAAGTRRRPYAIVAGLVATFAAFLLAGAWLWGLLGIDPKYQLKIGAALLLLLALTLIVPRVGEVLERPFLFLTRRRVGDAGGGLLLGASLGLVFVPCTGPILGTLIPLVGAHRSNFDVVLLVLVFSIGLAAPLLAIATGSRRAAASLRANGQTIRIAAGVVVALMAVVLYNGWAARVQTAVPGYVKWAQDLVEGNHSVKRELAQLREGDRSTKSAASRFASPSLAVAPARLKVPLTDYGAAPGFHGISSWVNTPGLSLGALHGHTRASTVSGRFRTSRSGTGCTAPGASSSSESTRRSSTSSTTPRTSATQSRGSASAIPSRSTTATRRGTRTRTSIGRPST